MKRECFYRQCTNNYPCLFSPVQYRIAFKKCVHRDGCGRIGLVANCWSLKVGIYRTRWWSSADAYVGPSSSGAICGPVHCRTFHRTPIIHSLQWILRHIHSSTHSIPLGYHSSPSLPHISPLSFYLHRSPSRKRCTINHVRQPHVQDSRSRSFWHPGSDKST